MRILLTNDDGIYAEGLYAAYKELSKIADVTVVAPDLRDDTISARPSEGKHNTGR